LQRSELEAAKADLDKAKKPPSSPAPPGGRQITQSDVTAAISFVEQKYQGQVADLTKEVADLKAQLQGGGAKAASLGLSSPSSSSSFGQIPIAPPLAPPAPTMATVSRYTGRPLMPPPLPPSTHRASFFGSPSSPPNTGSGAAAAANGSPPPPPFLSQIGKQRSSSMSSAPPSSGMISLPTDANAIAALMQQRLRDRRNHSVHSPPPP